MNRTLRALPALSLCAAIAASAAVADEPAARPAPAVGRPAPAFRLTTVDGRTVTLAGYRGKTLVINVWGSWCPPCRLETPDLAAEAAAMALQDVVFLGIDTTETAPVVRAYAAAKNVPYAQAATASRSDFARDYAITNYPTTIVVDPSGIVRAIHADNILPRTQLHAYIAAARAGRNAPLVSDEQRKLDAMLDPARFPFDGDPQTVVANARAASKAIGDAEDEMDDAMTDPARDHDLLKTHAEEGVLRDLAIAALNRTPPSPQDRALDDRMTGDSQVALGRFDDAERSYRDALAIDGGDREALTGLAYALSQRGDEAAVVTVDEQIAARYPSYASEIALARANAAAGNREAALAAIDAAIPLAQKSAPAAQAWTLLYAGRAAVEVGDTGRARGEFAAAGRAASLIPRNNPRYGWYLEQSQEALLALGLTGAHPAFALTMAPWTGPELPGSLAGTYKYRVALSGTPGSGVALQATGLPAGWIGSFCSDKLCSPFKLHTSIPPSGVKIVDSK